MKKYFVIFVCCLAAIFSAAAIFAQEQITGTKAMQIALTRSSGGTVIEMEWELKRGKAQFDVEIINSGKKHEIKIESATGKIITYKEKRVVVRELPPPPQNQVTFERVREIALAGRGNAIVEKIEWEYKYGQYVYEVSLRQDGKKSKVYIDAATGRTLTPVRRGWM